MACHIQGAMFEQTAALGGLDVQLVFYRGYGECKASPWVSDPRALLDRMTRVRCRAGRTQIGRVLRHAITETRRRRVHALVFIGDSMEENIDLLADAAGTLGVLGVPVFLFHEGRDAGAGLAFEEIARLSRGACCRFDAGSPRALRALLGAAAVYAAGGRTALLDYAARTGAEGGEALRRLTRRLDHDTHDKDTQGG